MVFWDRPLGDDDDTNNNQNRQQTGFVIQKRCIQDPENIEQIKCQKVVQKLNPNTNKLEIVEQNTFYLPKKNNQHMLGEYRQQQNTFSFQSSQQQNEEDMLGKEIQDLQKDLEKHFSIFGNMTLRSLFQGLVQPEIDQMNQQEEFQNQNDQNRLYKQELSKQQDQQNFPENQQKPKDEKIYDFQIIY